MGLSASQARLLSVTSRLSKNELASQMLTNSKIRLAEDQLNATEKYTQALSATTLDFVNYTEDGVSKTQELTPALLYAYQPLKNQYILQNAQGKNLVSAVDARNYLETNSLNEFLDRYGLVEEVETIETKTVGTRYVPTTEEFTYTDTELVQVTNPAYATDWADYNIGLTEWESITEPKLEDYQREVYKPNIVVEESTSTVSLYDTFVTASEACYKHATELEVYDVFGTLTPESYTPDCYLHVLEHMLNSAPASIYQDYEAHREYYDSFRHDSSLGKNYFIDVDTQSAIYKANSTDAMLPIAHVVLNGYDLNDGNGVQTLYATAHPAPADPSTAEDWELMISDYYLQNGNPTDQQVLLSNYCYDKSGNITLKTLKQKCIDLYAYIYDNITGERGYVYEGGKDWEIYTNILLPLIETFQEDLEVELKNLNFVDKGGVEVETDLTSYNDALDLWLNRGEKPPEPTTPEFIWEEQEVTKTGTRVVQTPEQYDIITKTDKLFLNDEDKGQWYTNLWYLMNGSDTANLVRCVQDEESEKTRFYVMSAEKADIPANYIAIENELMSSASWLQFALENGIVTMMRTSYKDDVLSNEKVPELDRQGVLWGKVEFNTVADIVEVEDKKAIAIAEVEYEKTIKEIQKIDVEYDLELKQLDTEHSSLKSEYDSVKKVISKNAERSFTAFS